MCAYTRRHEHARDFGPLLEPQSPSLAASGLLRKAVGLRPLVELCVEPAGLCGCRNTPISRPTLEKNPMPGHLFDVPSASANCTIKNISSFPRKAKSSPCPQLRMAALSELEKGFF